MTFLHWVVDLPGAGHEALQREVRVGSYVQWTSAGVDRFSVPQKIIGINGEWAFVEGSPTGVPMSELIVADAPVNAGEKTPPPNPHFKPSLAITEGPTITFPLPNDNAIEIRLKKPVSEKDFKRIQQLVELSKDSLVASE